MDAFNTDEVQRPLRPRCIPLKVTPQAARPGLFNFLHNLANDYTVSHKWIMPISYPTDCYKSTSPPTDEERREREEDLRPSSSSGAVCGKDIISTACDLLFFFSAMTLKKLLVADTPLLEDKALSNSFDPSGESPSSPMVRAQPNTTSVPSATSTSVPSPLAATALTPDMTPDHTSSLGHLSPSPFIYIEGAEWEEPANLPPIILKMIIFGLASNSTGHVVNYNIHMDLHTAFVGLECRAFPATLNEQVKMWFTSLAPVQ
ncbi:hypothetical protein ACLOJK_011576 [Asimina triloba]